MEKELLRYSKPAGPLINGSNNLMRALLISPLSFWRNVRNYQIKIHAGGQAKQHREATITISGSSFSWLKVPVFIQDNKAQCSTCIYSRRLSQRKLHHIISTL